MPPFLLLSLRRDRTVAAAEYRDFLRATGLGPGQLVHRMLDHPQATVGDLSQFAGVFVGGSHLNLVRPEPGVSNAWQRHINHEVQRLVGSPVPTIVICYGAGVLAQATGGAAGVTHPENSGPTEVRLTSDGSRDPLFGGLPARFTALTGHTENVTALGPGAALLATGPTCPIQAARYGSHVWACQFHAEMDPEAMAIRMSFFSGHGYFSDATSPMRNSSRSSAAFP